MTDSCENYRQIRASTSKEGFPITRRWMIRPSRREMMNAEKLGQVLAYAAKNPFETINITGGAPESHMQIREMIEGFAPLATRVLLLLRTNLTALQRDAWERRADLCRDRGVVLIASLLAAVYRPRNPHLSDYYRCVEDYFETIVRIHDEHFSRQY